MTDWTEARVETLRSMCAEGMPFSAIGAELGVSKNAVIGKADRLSLARPKRQQSSWGEAESARLRELCAGGLSAGLIAKQMSAEFRANITRSAVLGRIRRLRLTARVVTIFKPRPDYGGGAIQRIKSKTRAMKRPAPTLVPATEPTGPGLPFLDVLFSGGCKFAVSPHDAETHLFCGEAREGGQPYCGWHAQIAYGRDAA